MGLLFGAGGFKPLATGFVLFHPGFGITAILDFRQDFLHHLQAKAFQNRTVGLIENGSWAPTAAKTMRNILETMKNITIVEPVVTIKSVLKETDIPALDQLADALK